MIKTMPAQHPHQSFQNYVTPKGFIDAVEARFGNLDIDLAATNETTRCERYISPQEDSLKTKWPNNGELCWLNPPFGDIKPWAVKCERYRRQTKVLMLVPASVGASWFRDHVMNAAHVIFLSPRLTFDRCYDSGKVLPEPSPYPKDLILCCYNVDVGLPAETKFSFWTWRERKKK